MARPRTDDKHPLRRLLRAVERGAGVEPEHQAHLLAVTRQALAEAEGYDFGIFVLVASAMVVRLYARSLASQDAITVARCLGEVVRSLRALHLLGTAGRLGGGGGLRRGRRGGLPVGLPPCPGGADGGPADSQDAGGDKDAPRGDGGDDTTAA